MKTGNKKRVFCAMLAVALCLQWIVGENTFSQAAKKTKIATQKMSLTVGQKKTIKLKNKKKKATYSYSSSKKKIAVVSKKGKVTAKKKGTTYITVKEKQKGKKRTVGKVKVVVKKKKAVSTKKTTATKVPSVNTTGGVSQNATVKPTIEPGNNKPVPTAAPAEEYIINEGFESGDRGNFTQMGNVTLKVVSGGHESEKALKVSGRTDTWNGTDYNLVDLIETESEYQISGWVKNEMAQATSMSITVCYTPSDGDTQYVQAATTSVEPNTWTELKGSFSIPEGASGYKFYFELNDKTGDFYVDDVKLSGKKADVNEPDLDEFVEKYYESAVSNTFVSTGNSYRMKKVIEKAQAGEDVYLAFIGGSITEGADLSKNSDCYANQTYLQFKEKYGAGDGSNVHYVNAGMSGTPSALGSIRYERDVVQALGGIEPDLVFVEFAVNDGGNQELNFRTYESFVRSLLQKSNAPAVMLIFSVFDTGFNLQSYYEPVGTAYSLPMVSIKNGITSEIAAGHISNKQFFNMTSSTPGLHPNQFGAKFMADSIINTIVKTNAETDELDADMPSQLVFGASSTMDGIKGDSFEGITMIDPNTIPQEVVLDKGSFDCTDSNVGTFLFNNKSKFPTNWQHSSTSGSESFAMTVNCKNMLLAYKLSNSAKAGKIDIYVDGNKVTTLDGYSSSGWNNAETALIFNDETAAEHDIEIKMAEGNEEKEFTILTLGYTK